MYSKHEKRQEESHSKVKQKKWKKVESGSCTCSAGNSAYCNHVLGLLFETAIILYIN